MKFVEVLKECETAAGAGSKQVIKNALSKLDQQGRVLMNYAQNPYLVYGVKQFTRPISYAESDTLTTTPLCLILDQLAARELTGDAARNAVTEVLSTFTKETASYLERIIDKDLKAGFSAETYSKIWKNEPIPSFEVMLAAKCDEIEDFEKEITFPCFAEHKLDGERTIAIVTDKSITYYSRSGKEAKHVDGLFDEDLKALHKFLGYDFVLDGERYASNFTETMNAKKTGNSEAKDNLRFHAFFLMPLSDWIAQKTTITMRENREHLELLADELELKKIILTKGREVQNYHDMMEYCNEAIDVHGVEGLILKGYESTYSWDRTYSWTKVKRFHDIDARIVAFYKGRPKTRLEHTIAGADCVGFLEDGTRVEFSVGSGFSDKDRADMLAHPQKWLDGTHVFKYQEVSKGKNKEHSSLRFPTFERGFRDDKTVEL